MKDTIELIAAIVGIVIPVATAAVALYKYFKVKKEKKALERQVRNIASTGVALGYYYNFLNEILLKLRASRLKIRIYRDESEQVERVREYDTQNVSIHVIIPDSLKVEDLGAALEKMHAHRKGDIVSPGAERNFGVNLRFDGPDKIIVLDFPKPLNAIREHLLHDPLFIGSLDERGRMVRSAVLDSEAWKKAEREELENFKATLYGLMERGGLGIGRSKIRFVAAEEVPDEREK